MKKIFIFSLLLTGITISSCKKQLNQSPKYGLNAEVVYSDPANYIKVLAKLYAGLSMTGNQGPAGQADIAGLDEGFSGYVRVLWNLQELPTDEAICGWNDPGIPELNKSEPVNTFSPFFSYILRRIVNCRFQVWVLLSVLPVLPWPILLDFFYDSVTYAKRNL